MPSTRALKFKIRSVGSTKKITRAMQVVSTSRMRRARLADEASKPYVEAATELLSFLATPEAREHHPLFAQREVKSRLLIVIAGDRGLAGAYNSNVFKQYVQQLQSDRDARIRNKTITIGRRAGQFVSRLKDATLIASYDHLTDQPSGKQLFSILDQARDQFISGEIDQVDVIYTRYINGLKQEVTSHRLLPAGFTTVAVSDDVKRAVFEPSQTQVLNAVTYRLIGSQLFQTILDAKASEHSMRMMAMKNATDSASDIIDDLTLAMHKARQAAVTQEITEISAGTEALKES